MRALAELLNPLLDERDDGGRSPRKYGLSVTALPHNSSPPLTSHKKRKVVRDTAVFTKSSTKGPVNYPPYEDLEPSLVTRQQEFNIAPSKGIAECPHHIPYSSDKRSFVEGTGRENFEGCEA